MSTIPIGSTDSARRAQAVIVVDRATGEPAAAGGGAGTSDTTEATQLLVKTAVESIAADGATEATQLEVAGNTDRAADALVAMQADTSTSPVAQVPYVNAATITPGTPVTAGQGVAIRCTAEGNVGLKLSSGVTLVVAMKVGQSWIDNLAVTDVVAGSTTGTHVVSVLYRA